MSRRSATTAVRCSAAAVLLAGLTAAPPDPGGALLAASAPPPSPCDRIGPATVVGEVGTSELAELSGIGASRTLAGTLWAHADSGDSARLFALDERGGDLGTYEVRGLDGGEVTATDWEDIAVVRDPGSGSGDIYVADIGDNAAARSGGVTLYRMAEPSVPPDGTGGTLTVDAALVVRYPDGPADAEALLVDPVDGTTIILTKDLLGSSVVLTVPATSWVAGRSADVVANVAGHLDLGLAELAQVGGLDADLPGTLVTAADVSPDGSVAVVRTYQALVLVERAAGTTLADAVLGAHCLVPGPEEPQGEAVAITADGTAILTATEVQRAVDNGELPVGATSPIQRLTIAAATPAASTPADSSSSPDSSSTPVDSSVDAPTTSATASATSRPDGGAVVSSVPEPTPSTPAAVGDATDGGSDDRAAAYLVAALGAAVAVGVIVVAVRPRRR